MDMLLDSNIRLEILEYANTLTQIIWNGEEKFEDTEGVIRSRKMNKDS